MCVREPHLWVPTPPRVWTPCLSTMYGPKSSAPVGAGAVGLPLGLWSTVRSDAGGLVVEVGRFADDGRARQLAQRRYDADGWLLDVVLGAEVRVA